MDCWQDRPRHHDSASTRPSGSIAGRWLVLWSCNSRYPGESDDESLSASECKMDKIHWKVCASRHTTVFSARSSSEGCKREMRVLIAVHGYPPTHSSGAELRAERTAKHLHARGNDVIVVCVEKITPNPNEWMVDEQAQQGILVHRIIFGYSQGDAQLRERYDNPYVNAALEQVISVWKPDLIHMFSGYLMGIGVVASARAHSIPTVVSLTDYWWLCHRINLVTSTGRRCGGPTPFGCAQCYSMMSRRYKYPSNALGPVRDAVWSLVEHSHLLDHHLHVDEHARREELLLETLNQVDVIVSPSRFLAQVHELHGVDAARICVLRQGVDLDSFPLRKQANSIRFAYFGQIKHHKGVHTIIDAWLTLKSDRARTLSIYGDATGEEAYLERLQRKTEHADNVFWRGKIPHVGIWSRLAETDVAIVSSRWVENSPNVILEAQAMGVPVIGTDLGGVAELVQDEWNGLLFEPDDATSLASQFGRILDHPELIGAFRRQSFPTSHVLEEITQLETLYQLAVKRHGNANTDRYQVPLHGSQREIEWLQDMANFETEKHS